MNHHDCLESFFFFQEKYFFKGIKKLAFEFLSLATYIVLYLSCTVMHISTPLIPTPFLPFDAMKDPAIICWRQAPSSGRQASVGLCDRDCNLVKVHIII